MQVPSIKLYFLRKYGLVFALIVPRVQKECSKLTTIQNNFYCSKTIFNPQKALVLSLHTISSSALVLKAALFKKRS